MNITKLLPSELITLAVRDLEKVEKDPGYSVEMNDWHRFSQLSQTCRVCFAGSIMAKSFDLLPTECVGSGDSDFTPDEWRCFAALDYFRVGDVQFALEELKRPHPSELEKNFDVDPYHRSPEKFKRRMRAMSRLLRYHGL
jgi:hypothetical protein